MSIDLLKRKVKKGANRSIISFRILFGFSSSLGALSSGASLRASLTLYSTISV
jgi:hypothetical protein